MNSRALLHLDDEDVEVALVYPDDADDSAERLSDCSGIGTAILGYQEGALMATSNSPTCGLSNSPRQDGRIVGRRSH